MSSETAGPRPSPTCKKVTFMYKSEIATEKKEKNNKLETKESLEEPIKRQSSPCESKERSLDGPTARSTGQKCNSRLKGVDNLSDKSHASLVKIQVENCWKDGVSEKDSKVTNNAKGCNSESPTEHDCKGKKCSDEPPQQDSSNVAKKSYVDNKNKFTWCGSCKSSKSTAAVAAATVAAAHDRPTKKQSSSSSHLKKLSRSSLSIEPADSSKITLNLSKYSPCATRLAACSKILNRDSTGNTSPESPLHVARAKSPVQSSVPLTVQRPNSSGKAMRTKSVSGADSCLTSPTSDATNLSCSPPTTEVLSLEDVSNNSKQGLEEQPRTAEAGLDRERWNHRSPR